MLESFALNGRVGDIGIKDKTIEVKLVFPNDERTQDELAFLFPIKKGLATVRILAAVNKGYTPGRRRSDRDETGTPLLPGVDMREECHGCGRMVDCVNEPFFAKPVPGENGAPSTKEIILCDACYMVPQPETIDTPAAVEGSGDANAPATCADCLNFKPPEEGVEEGACAIHAGDPLGAYKKPGEIACDKFAAKPITLLGFPIVEDPSLRSGEVIFGTVEQIGDPDLVTKPSPPLDSTPEQLEQAADAILKGAPLEPCCVVCGHARGEKYIRDVRGKGVQVFWKTVENDQGVFEQCPKCAHLNQFPEEGGGKEGEDAA